MTSELSQERQAAIVKILTFLHEGGDFDESKQMFKDQFDQVDVAEITAAERQLIAGGLNPIEIQNLCNVHVALFEGQITDNQGTPAFQKPGHPVHTMKLENMVINSLVNDELLPCLKKWQQDGADNQYLVRMRKALQDLKAIGRHYKRKELTIFPIMNKYGITAPPQVMWGVDDQIRDLIQRVNDLVNQDPLPDKYEIEAAVTNAANEVTAMIFKEEDIMIPMLAEVASPEDWATARQDEEQFGYTLINPPLPWKPTQAEIEEAKAHPHESSIAVELNAAAIQMAQADSQAQGHLSTQEVYDQLNDKQLPVALTGDDVRIDLGSGTLSGRELKAIFPLLPLDLTFVDENDRVQWFTDTDDRIFPRTKSVLGRSVFECHPPRSVDKVKKIIAELHAGSRDRFEYWFNLHGERFVYVQYIGIHDADGQYLGCLECSQDISKFKELTGEQRR